MRSRLASAKSFIDAEDRIKQEYNAELAKARIEIRSQAVAELAQKTSTWAVEKASLHDSLRSTEEVMYTRVVTAVLQRMLKRCLLKSLWSWQQWTQSRVAARLIVQKIAKRIKAMGLCSTFELWQTWSQNQRRLCTISERMIRTLTTRAQTKSFATWHKFTEHEVSVGQLLRKIAKRLEMICVSSTFCAWQMQSERLRHVRELSLKLTRRICDALIWRAWSSWRMHHRRTNRMRQLTQRLHRRIALTVLEVWIGMVVHARYEEDLHRAQPRASSPTRLSTVEEQYSKTPTQCFTDEPPLTASSNVFDSPTTPADQAHGHKMDSISTPSEDNTARKLVLSPARDDYIDDELQSQVKTDQDEAATSGTPLHDVFHLKQQQRKLLTRVAGRLLHPLLAKAFGSWTLYFTSSVRRAYAVQRGLRGARRWHEFASPADAVAPSSTTSVLPAHDNQVENGARLKKGRGLKGLNGGITPESMRDQEPLGISTPAANSDEDGTPQAALTKHVEDDIGDDKEEQQKTGHYEFSETAARPEVVSSKSAECDTVEQEAKQTRRDEQQNMQEEVMHPETTTFVQTEPAESGKGHTSSVLPAFVPFMPSAAVPVVAVAAATTTTTTAVPELEAAQRASEVGSVQVDLAAGSSSKSAGATSTSAEVVDADEGQETEDEQAPVVLAEDDDEIELRIDGSDHVYLVEKASSLVFQIVSGGRQIDVGIWDADRKRIDFGESEATGQGWVVQPDGTRQRKEYCGNNERLMSLKHRNHVANHPGVNHIPGVAIYPGAKATQRSHGKHSTVASVEAWAQDRRQKKASVAAAAAGAQEKHAPLHSAFHADFGHELDLPDLAAHGLLGLGGGGGGAGGGGGDGGDSGQRGKQRSLSPLQF